MDIEAISRDYGEKVHTFFERPLSQNIFLEEEAKTTIESVIEGVQVAVGVDKRYQIAEIEASVDGLTQLLDGL